MPNDIPIVPPGATIDEKGLVVCLLADRVGSKTKSRKAFDRLFGTQSPHAIIERLLRMSSRALSEDVNRNIFTLLATNQALFYADKEFPIKHNMMHTSDWSDGTLLDRWEKRTKKANPHHIVARSRGGTNSSRNLWLADRSTHDDFHLVFQNLTPFEQMAMILQLYRNEFGRDFQDKVQKLLKSDYREPTCYQPGVIDIHKYV